jgi:hypothetical protein
MKTEASAEAHSRRAADLVLEHNGKGTMASEHYRTYLGESRAAKQAFVDADDLKRREDEYRAKVVNEPGPYDGPNSPNSQIRLIK